jgi:hypothetical protein
MVEETMILIAEVEEEKEPTERRRQLVSEILERIQDAEKHHRKSFKQMRADMEAAYRGFDQGHWSDDRYVANILQRHVQQRTAALYAKNPVAIATRRNRMMHQIWDGDPASLDEAKTLIAASQQAGMPPPMSALELIGEVEQVRKENLKLDRIGQTLEHLFRYFMDEQQPTFKSQMKALVRRVITTGVGFVKIGYQREMERAPEVSSRISDVTAQLDHLKQISKKASKGEIAETDPQIEELELSLQSLMNEPLLIMREGLVFDFPDPDAVIVDPMCRQLRGFVGASWIAHKIYMTPEEAEEIYDIDLKSTYTSYTAKGMKANESNDVSRYNRESDVDLEELVCIYEYYDRKSGLMYTVCDGYKDFLQTPDVPPVSVESFWPVYALVFNEMEYRESLYPPSDIQMLLPMQHEYNRARQGLREHRRSNRPKYAIAAGMLEEDDKTKLKSHPANAILELQGLASGQRVADVIQPIQQIGIDPNLYEVRTIFDDVQLVVGSQEANFGQVSKATATETSIAESSRMSALGANVDELDSFMSEVARSAGQVLLSEMSIDEVRRIAGPGAVWPEMSREQIMSEIFLEIEAGSTGKPNKAAELRNIERIAPIVLQLPNVDPMAFAREILKRLDDKLDLSTILREGTPSIVALNQMANPQGGVNRPEMQGGQGGFNAPGLQNMPEGAPPAMRPV